jgi:hypothetical protein
MTCCVLTAFLHGNRPLPNDSSARIDLPKAQLVATDRAEAGVMDGISETQFYPSKNRTDRTEKKGTSFAGPHPRNQSTSCVCLHRTYSASPERSRIANAACTCFQCGPLQLGRVQRVLDDNLSSEYSSFPTTSVRCASGGTEIDLENISCSRINPDV